MSFVWTSHSLTHSFHDVEEHVGRATGCIWLSLSAHVRVIALVPLLVAKVVHFTDVVATVERATMVRDSVQLILCSLSFTSVVCTKNSNKLQSVIQLNSAKKKRVKRVLLEWGA